MLRSDAIATLYFFRPLRSLIPSRRRAVPILMYHSVSDAVPDAKHPYYQTVTTPRVFAEHMRLLREEQFTSVSLGDAVKYLESDDAPALKPVVITFDDGFRDFLTNAFPVLERNGLTATMFLPTAFIGSTTKRFKGIECLTWGEVRDLHAAGIEFGSHTVTHPQLRDLAWRQVEEEVRDSKAAIEEELGCGVTAFAYPYAFPEADRAFTRHLEAILLGNGYNNGVCTAVGIARRIESALFLKRLPMNEYDDLPLFHAKLSGAYDWIHRLQYVAKMRTPATAAQVPGSQ